MARLTAYWANKVVIITGSSRGIGRETARLALQAQACVVLNGRDATVLQQTALALGGGDRLCSVACDVATPEGAQRLIEAAIKAFGRIDVLINNAGLSMRGEFGELSPLTVRSVLDANLLPAIFCTQAALPGLRLSRGRVGFVSSLAGLRGFPGVSLYSAAKLALAALRDSLAAEERIAGLRFSLIHVGFTENDPGKTVLGPDGQPFQHQRSWSLRQDQSALAILEAIRRGRAVTTLTLAGKALAIAERLTPGLTRWMIQRSGGTIHHVQRRG